MFFSLQELEKPLIRSNMLHDLHAMYVLLKILKASDHTDRAQENSDLRDVESGGKERLAASHSDIESCKDVLAKTTHVQRNSESVARCCCR